VLVDVTLGVVVAVVVVDLVDKVLEGLVLLLELDVTIAPYFFSQVVRIPDRTR
jgi:hypothetical protein